jgi:hypothetical protein
VLWKSICSRLNGMLRKENSRTSAQAEKAPWNLIETICP